KDPTKTPCGVAWSKLKTFSKREYSVLFELVDTPILVRPEILGEDASVEVPTHVVAKDASVEVPELVDDVRAHIVAKDATVDEVSSDREVATLKTILGLIDKVGGNVVVVDVVRKRLAAIKKFPKQSVNNDSENVMPIHNAEDGKLFILMMQRTYPGTNLLAVGMDGNNRIIHIATGVSQGETIESWSWFMTKLKECIGEVPGLAIISDRHPATINACNIVFPNAFHGYRKDEFERSIAQLQGLKPKAVRKLHEAGYSNWSRAHYPTNRYNYLTSNSAESINALRRDYRKLPITKLIEYYRKLVQNWYCERRDKYEDAPKDELTDWAAKKVNNIMLKSVNWQVDGIDQEKVYQVTGHRQAYC
nr:transposase, MuDR, MULE transposase domain protein [Tanacetum cinerariifolium]